MGSLWLTRPKLHVSRDGIDGAFWTGMRSTLILLLISSCTVSGEGSLTWAPAAQCTDVISHPCPLLRYARRATLVGDTLTWDDYANGIDRNGISAEAHMPAIETVIVLDGSIELAARGDDGGLRLATRLVPGVETAVTWDLFNIPGATTFVVTWAP